MSCTGTTIMFLCIALSMVAVGSAVSDDKHYNSSYISLAALECSNIDQTKQSSRKLADLSPLEPGCPVRFDLMTKFGTIGTHCSGRHVKAAKCCGALKAFACPYRDLMNDMSNGCSYEMMYTIISTYKLPVGVFSLMCHDVDQGLNCLN